MGVIVVKVKKGQSVPDVKKSVGCIYNDDKGDFIIIFAATCVEAHNHVIDRQKFEYFNGYEMYFDK